VDSAAHSAVGWAAGSCRVMNIPTYSFPQNAEISSPISVPVWHKMTNFSLICGEYNLAG